MSTKSYTFIPYHLQEHKVQSWEKKFHVLSWDTTEFWGPKKPIFRVVMIEGLQILVPRLVKYMQTKFHTH
jgi:hypothetical protein